MNERLRDIIGNSGINPFDDSGTDTMILASAAGRANISRKLDRKVYLSGSSVKEAIVAIDSKPDFSGLQPIFPILDITIAGVNVSSFTDGLSDPIMDFTYNRSANGTDKIGNKFELTMYDDTALEVEYLLAKELNTNGSIDVHIRYGYSRSGDTRYMTSEFTGNVVKYGLAFEGVGATLSIGGTINTYAGAVGSVRTVEYDADTYKGMPSEIVRAICEYEGWEIGYIEDTAPCMADDDTVEVFRQESQNSGEFILRKLCERSISAETGELGYIWFFDENGKVYFVSSSNCTVDVLEARKHAVESITKSKDSISKRLPGMTDGEYVSGSSLVEQSGKVEGFEISKKYEFYSGLKNSDVISFTPEFQGVAVGNMQAGTAMTVDTVRNEMIEYSLDGKTYNGDIARATKIVGLSSSSFDNLERKAASMWSTYSKMNSTATLEVMGDPTIRIQSACYIAVYTKYGLLHHTSGIYRINSVVDSISGGSYVSTLSLTKLGHSMEEARANFSTMEDYSYNSSDLQVIESGGGVAPSDAVENAVQWALNIANDNSHGYDQGSRNGPNYDCSSLVSTAFNRAGFNVNPSNTTSSMKSAFTSVGFKWYPAPFNKNLLQRGDILLKAGSHTELYIGDGKLVGASQNEDGGSRGGKSGDQTGKEIRVCGYFDEGWQGFLRYEGK